MEINMYLFCISRVLKLIIFTEKYFISRSTYKMLDFLHHSPTVSITLTSGSSISPQVQWYSRTLSPARCTRESRAAVCRCHSARQYWRRLGKGILSRVASRVLLKSCVVRRVKTAGKVRLRSSRVSDQVSGYQPVPSP
ncbi:hypothetical protein E2C01_083786 [Portunus trituberculatus]|uniref:Uncharacterized protein n=1 Tax=Portunus trituberculatus TaxID=210409 RepID=A0A5B7J8X9_PORTR|nr:hypothetical protein [Portunus trituberculatus]